jgi:predicted RNA-binding protein with PUA-like domain
MRYWLMKSEPEEFSIDDLENSNTQVIEWFGVRNYQARNFMLKDMQIGDLAFFWHSSCANPGIYGIVKIISNAHPDSTQFNKTSKYYDITATKDKPRWWCVDVKFVAKTKYISLLEIRQNCDLGDLIVLKRGNRLSITPITTTQWNILSVRTIANRV